MSALLPLLLVLVALGATLYPLVVRRLGPPRLTRTSRISHLRDRYQAALADLQDIELDRDVGNLAEADYAPLRERYRLQAAVLLRDLEEVLGSGFSVLDSSSTSTQHPAPRTRASSPNGVYRTFSLSWGLRVGTVLAVMASLGVVSLYLRQVQQQAAQAPLAQLRVTQPRGVAIDKAGYWVSHADGLLHSPDGKNWRPADLNGAVTGLLRFPSGTQVVLGRGLAVESTDGGATWARFPSDLPGSDVSGAQMLDDQAYAYVNGSGVFRSDDGIHWAGIGPGVGTPAGSLAALRPDLSGRRDESGRGIGPMMFLVTNGTVVRSTDDGHTWAAAAGAGNLALSGFVQSMAADPDRNALYAATDRGLFFSTALGTQWVQLPFRGGAAAVGVRGDQLAAVDAEGRFFLSRDRGATWQN